MRMPARGSGILIVQAEQELTVRSEIVKEVDARGRVMPWSR